MSWATLRHSQSPVKAPSLPWPQRVPTHCIAATSLQQPGCIESCAQVTCSDRSVTYNVLCLYWELSVVLRWGCSSWYAVLSMSRRGGSVQVVVHSRRPISCGVIRLFTSCLRLMGAHHCFIHCPWLEAKCTATSSRVHRLIAQFGVILTDHRWNSCTGKASRANTMPVCSCNTRQVKRS